MTDLALLDQAVTHVKQKGPWQVSFVMGSPLAHFTTIEAIRAEYQLLAAMQGELPVSFARTVPRFDDVAGG